MKVRRIFLEQAFGDKKELIVIFNEKGFTVDYEVLTKAALSEEIRKLNGIGTKV